MLLSYMYMFSGHGSGSIVIFSVTFSTSSKFFTNTLVFFARQNIETLIRDLNNQKNAIKKNGITVDDRHFKVKFTGDNASLNGVEFSNLLFTMS